MKGRGRVAFLTSRKVLLAAVAVVLVMLNLGTATVSRGIQGTRLISENRVTGWQAVIAEVSWGSFFGSLEDLNSSTVGSIASFTWWFEREWARPTWSMAYLPALFSGPLEQFGLADRASMVLETTSFDDGSQSNVYTLFRPIIQAFTLPGSLGVLFGLGILTGWAYRRVSAGHPGPIAVLFWFYSCMMVSGGLFFGYNSLDLAWVSVAAYLSVTGRHWRRSQPHAPLGRLRSSVVRPSERPRAVLGARRSVQLAREDR